MVSYNMRIANRVNRNKNGCYPFSEESIKNLPDIDIFIEQEVNNKMKLGCSDVLKRSMQASNKYRYGEMGIIISTLDDSVLERFNGTYHEIQVHNTNYYTIVSNRKVNDLIFIHNHPNNGTLSANDLINLCITPAITGVIAVGNRHNVFIAIKDDEKLAYKLRGHIESEGEKLAILDNNRNPIKYYKDLIAKDILTNRAFEFGLDYYVLRRKNK